MPTHKLTKLRMKEISGVDDPANELPGWIVAKAKEWEGEVEDLEKSVGSLYDGLTGEAADLYFTDAPEDVAKARETLIGHMADDVEEVEKDSGEPDPEPEETPARKQRRFRDAFRSKPAGDETPEPEETPAKKAAELAPPPGEEPAEETPAETAEPEAPAVDEEAIAKSVVSDLAGVIRETVDPLRDAVAALADRTENLEKHAARPAGLRGQETPAEPVQKDARTSLRHSIRRATAGEKVELGG